MNIKETCSCGDFIEIESLCWEEVVAAHDSWCDRHNDCKKKQVYSMADLKSHFQPTTRSNERLDEIKAQVGVN